VGYNVQAAVDAKHHLIVEHEVTNVGNDHGQLSKMALSAKTAMGKTKLKVLADRGYFSGSDIRACDLNNISAYVPKPETRCHDHPPKYCRACLGHAQALDGSCTLPDPDAWPREHGDEPSSTGLQPQARHEYTWVCRDDEGDEDGWNLKPRGAFLRTRCSISASSAY
jgi:hypothetical protein